MKTLFFLQHLIKYMELAAAVTGFIYWKKLKKNYYKWFPVYLAIIAACEFIGYLLKLKAIAGNKELYSYFVIPLEFLFFHWMYYKTFGKKGKTVVLICSALYLLSFVAENFIIQGTNLFFFSLSYSIGNITLLVLIIIYFLDLMKSQRIIVFYKDLFFWINSGLVLFYLGTFPYYGLFNFLVKENYDIFIGLTWAMVILDLLMYLFFIIGFIWSKQK